MPGEFVAANVQRAKMPLKLIRINVSTGELCLVLPGGVASFGKCRS